MAAFAGSLAASIDRALLSLGRAIELVFLRWEKRRVAGSIYRWRRRGALDVDASAPEDEKVEIELTRTPTLARAAAELALERLERGQESDRAAFRVWKGGDVERDHGVAKLGLVGDADRVGRVKARDAAQPRAG